MQEGPSRRQESAASAVGHSACVRVLAHPLLDLRERAELLTTAPARRGRETARSRPAGQTIPSAGRVARDTEVEMTRRGASRLTHCTERLPDAHTCSGFDPFFDQLEVGHVVADAVIAEDRAPIDPTRRRVVDARVVRIQASRLEDHAVDGSDNRRAAANEDVSGWIPGMRITPTSRVHIGDGHDIRGRGFGRRRRVNRFVRRTERVARSVRPWNRA